MKLGNIAMDNIKRRRKKMLFLVLGMVIGIATIVTIFSITEAMQQDVQQKLDEYGANIMIVPKANTLSMTYGGISIPGAQYDVRQIKEERIDSIWEIKNKNNLATVSEKLLGAVDVDGETILLVGAELATEIKLKKWWKFTPESGIELVRVEKASPIDPTKMVTVTEIAGLKEEDILIGSGVAEKLNKKPGDAVTLSSNGREMSFNVRAVIEETGSQDDSIIFMNLRTAQRLLGKEGEITLVEVAAICSGCPVEEMARQINEAIPDGKATPIKQVVEQKMQTIKQISNFGMAVGVIILLIGSLMVFTTMMASVNERTREIGIFRAIGFRKQHIARIFITEALVLSLVSGAIGYALGIIVTSIAGSLIAEVEIASAFDPYLAVAAVALAVLVGTAATVYPALKASKIDPAEALRQI
ncbi:MAG: FtsX-like permease family protein [archaeon]